MKTTIEWIPVERELPPERPSMNYKKYLVATSAPFVLVVDWMNGKWWRNCAACGNAMTTVTHWAHLPKHPKELEDTK